VTGAVVAIILRRFEARQFWRACPFCGYDLRKNVSGQCPECGEQNADDLRERLRLEEDDSE